MIKDINRPEVKGVSVAVVRTKIEGDAASEWNVYLLNRNKETLVNVFVSSSGYGNAGEKTATMRHFFTEVLPNTFHKIEPIDSAIFGITNEYLVSYFIDNQIFDKSFIFQPNTIQVQSLSLIEPFGFEGLELV